jgi:DNA replication protein DnaC
MSKYDPELYNKAIEILKNKREKEEAKSQEIKEKFLRITPEAKQILDEISQSSIHLVKYIAKNDSESREKIMSVKERNLSLQKRYEELLSNSGLTYSQITPDYSCKRCNDTGYDSNGNMCSCLKKLLDKLYFEKISLTVPLKKSTFENFDLSYYDCLPIEKRKSMQHIYDECKNYALSFTIHSESLLFMGSTGVGKTHLSLAIAGFVIKKGYTVLYNTIQNYMVSIDNQRFSNSGNNFLNSMIDCDLLILDDLGAENGSPYANACLYSVIETRLMKNIPTIISTNLSMNEINKDHRYTPRLVSRLGSDYKKCIFYGKDNRQRRNNTKEAAYDAKK